MAFISSTTSPLLSSTEMGESGGSAGGSSDENVERESENGEARKGRGKRKVGSSEKGRQKKMRQEKEKHEKDTEGETLEVEQAVTQGLTQAEDLFSSGEPLCGDEPNGRRQNEPEPCPNKEQNDKNDKKLFSIFTTPSNGLNNRNPVMEKKKTAKSKSNFKERAKNFYSIKKSLVRLPEVKNYKGKCKEIDENMEAIKVPAANNNDEVMARGSVSGGEGEMTPGHYQFDKIL